jgi:hypothetical protein
MTHEQPAIESFCERVSLEAGTVRFQLTNGEDVEVSVRAVSDAAIDRMRFGTSYDVEALNGSRAARQWVALNEGWAIDLWEARVARAK